MGELGRIHQLIIPFFGHNITLNLEVIVMTWIVFLILIGIGFLSARKRGIFPKAMQMFGELFVSQFYGLVEDALDKKMAKTYGPLICALFMFLVLANWLGIIPHLEEPTKDLNTPLSLGVMGFVIAHYAGIKSKGFKAYAAEYFAPRHKRRQPTRKGSPPSLGRRRLAARMLAVRSIGWGVPSG